MFMYALLCIMYCIISKNLFEVDTSRGPVD